MAPSRPMEVLWASTVRTVRTASRAGLARVNQDAQPRHGPPRTVNAGGDPAHDPVTRPLFTALLVLALLSGVAAPPVGAQGAREAPQRGEGPATELRDEFPLKQPAPGSGEQGGQSSASAPRPSRQDQAGDGSSRMILVVVGGLVALAALALLVRARIRARRRRTRAARAGLVVPIPSAPTPLDEAAPADTAKPATSPGVATQRAVGYASVSSADDLNNAELRVQVRLIQEACQRRGLTLVKIVRDVESHASSDLRRPGLTYALDRLAARDASCLVVSSLERLTRTAANLGALLGWLTECDARLVVIDLDLDTSTEEGQLGARALATVGGLERRNLEERTRKGLEAAGSMPRSGRPAVSDRPSLKHRIAEMRDQGMTLQAIADTLNAEGVPTLRGGMEWRPSSVQAAAGYKRPRRKGVLQGLPRDKRA
jgi:DNA invertase Pin-like site-specific DNA recombinase